jgi:hypothetical protein
MRPRRWLVWLSGVAGVCVLVLGYGFYRMHARRQIKDQLPSFTEPGPGPRAPSSSALGFVVGSSSLASVQQALARAGLTCADTSMRALMQQGRDEIRRQMQAREARGEDPDSVTGASRVDYRSPKEANPQVRLACDGVPSRKLEGGQRVPSRGRLLLVFDSPAHPLRHVSFERTFSSADIASALADLDTTRARLAAVFGNATAGVPVDTDTRDLPWLSPRETRWHFVDLQVKASAINYGPRGVVVSEVVEVPWPVRSDAPTSGVRTRRPGSG